MDKSDVVRRLSGLKTVPDLRARPPGEAAEGAAPSSETVAAKLPERSEAVLDDVRSFVEAGWTFSEADAGTVPEGFGVVLDTDGHLKLAGTGLTARFAPDLDRGTVEEIAEGLGLTIRREVKFAPNTFQFSTEGEAALDIARSLNDRDDVLYAEPDLLEPMRSRR